MQAVSLRHGGKEEVWRGPQGSRTLEPLGAVQDVLPAKLRSQAAQCTRLIGLSTLLDGSAAASASPSHSPA
jgi:hypothetical protein